VFSKLVEDLHQIGGGHSKWAPIDRRILDGEQAKGLL